MSDQIIHRTAEELFALVQNGRVRSVAQFLQQATPQERLIIHQPEGHGWTMVHIAAKSGNVDLLQILEQFGADLNQPTYNDSRAYPIHLACTEGHIGVVKYLVQKQNVNINIKDSAGYTPIAYAAMEKHHRIIRGLVELGADLNATNTDGRGLAHLACAVDDLQLLHTLSELGFDFNKEDNLGQTALAVACACGTSHLVAYLVRHGCDFRRPDPKKNTPLHWASTSQDVSCFSLLILLGADQNEPNANGETPFHLACRLGETRIIDFLVSHPKTKYNIADDQLKYPLDHVEDIPALLEAVSSFSAAMKIIYRTKKFSELFRFSFWKLCFTGFGGYSSPAAFSLQWVLTIISFHLYFCYFLPFSGIHSLEFYWTFPSILFPISAVFTWIFYLASWLSDPGLIKPDENTVEEYFDAVEVEATKQQQNLPNERSQTSQLSLFCKTCHIEKPIRSKHCSICGCCILMKDHHCAFIGNCVGQNNMIWFILYLMSTFTSLTTILLLSLLYLYFIGFDFIVIFGFILLFCGEYFVSSLLTYHFWLLKLGITTNEHANWYRYSHMMDEAGNFHNPFNKGLFRNLKVKLFSFRSNLNNSSTVSPLIPRKNRYESVDNALTQTLENI